MAQSILVRGKFLPQPLSVVASCLCGLALLLIAAGCRVEDRASGRLPPPASSGMGAAPKARAQFGDADALAVLPGGTEEGGAEDAATEVPEPSQSLTPRQIAGILHVEEREITAALVACASGSTADRARCLIRARYVDDPTAGDLAVRLYEVAGSVAGLEPEHDMDGGWRGKLHLVPELPVRSHRKQLAWVLAAAEDHERFFDALRDSGGTADIAFRHRDLGVHFFRSVGRTTPSAYASGWRVAYNVSGSLHKTEAAVRETLFHEIFHLNDAAHGDWSSRALTPTFEAIVSRCGTNITCLSPYAPNDTLVRGGTFYAFQPGNGVWEYSAELAIRYFREHRRQLGLPTLAVTGSAFKCGPEENRRAWQLMVDEFFGGVDLVPPC